MRPNVSRSSVRRFATLLAPLALWFGLTPADAQRGEGPFAGLAGSWSGAGTVMFSNGSSERIRCRTTYQVGNAGGSLQQNMRCASDSYRFDLTASIEYRGGAISGTWSEATRGTGGNLSGQASAGQISARVDSPGFSADLSVATRGNRQAVTIRSQGTELTGVSLTLTRG